MKSESTTTLAEPVQAGERVWRIKLTHSKALLKFSVLKRHGQANTLGLEINGHSKFEIGNDCDTCHFWFKCLKEPKPSTYQKKIVNLPKTISLPRPLDDALVQELMPILDIMDKGEYYLFNTQLLLNGPYTQDDESSYFYNTEFLELWNIESPSSEDILSGWEHYEGRNPRVFRREGVLEKQFDFVVPLVPAAQLSAENIRLYQQMIANGDRPRVFLLGMLQRGIPETVSSGRAKTLHSFFASFVLDGHHKLAAYRRAAVPANCLVLLSQKASKYALLRSEGGDARQRLQERLSALAV